MADYDLREKDLNALRVIDLKKELEKRGLPKSGTKKDLVDRLKAQLELEKLRERSIKEGERIPTLEIDSEAEQNAFVRLYLAERNKVCEELHAEDKRKREQSFSSNVDAEEVSDEPVVSVQPVDTVSASKTQDKSPVKAISESVKHEEPPTALREDKAVQQQTYSVPSIAVQDTPLNLASNAPVSHVDDVKVTESKLSDAKLPTTHAVEDTDKLAKPEVLITEVCSESDQGVNVPKSDIAASINNSTATEVHSSQSKLKMSPEKTDARFNVGLTAVLDEPATLIVIKKSASPAKPSLDSISTTVTVESEEMRADLGDSVTLTEDSDVLDGSLTQQDIQRPLVEIKKAREVAKVVEALTQKKSSEVAKTVSDVPARKKISESEAPRAADMPAPNKTIEVTKPEEVRAPVRILPPSQRKRKWGSTNKVDKCSSINISSESLQTLIPGIGARTKDEGEMSSDDSLKSDDDSLTEDESDGQAKLKGSGGRTVEVLGASEPQPKKAKKDDNAAESAAKDRKTANTREVTVTTNKSEADANKLKRTISESSRAIDHGALSTAVAPEEPVLLNRPPTPPRNPVSCILHFQKLVRPFTVGQLKQLLSRYGKLTEDGFWINKIKSHCFAVFESEEDAAKARESLHGSRWPPTNPWQLSVDYSTKDVMEAYMKGIEENAPPTRKVAVVSPAPQQSRPAPAVDKTADKLDSAGKAQSPSRDKIASVRDDRRIKGSTRMDEDVKSSQSRQEGDRRGDRDQSAKASRKDERSRDDRENRDDKTRKRDRKDDDDTKGHSRSDEKPKSRNVAVERSPEPEAVEAPAKLLDDLFRKTKALPCIYWLPLTEQQIAEKASKPPVVQHDAVVQRDDQQKEGRVAEASSPVRDSNRRPDHGRDRSPPGGKAGQQQRRSSSPRHGRRGGSRERAAERRAPRH